MTVPRSTKTAQMTFMLILLGVRDATAGPGELKISSIDTEEQVRTRSLAPSFSHSEVSMRWLSRENEGEYSPRCPAQCPATFFHAPKDVEKCSAAATSVHPFGAKGVLLRNIVKSALRNVSKVPWWITSCKSRMVTSNSTKIPSLCRHVDISWRFRVWTGTWECLSTTSCPQAFPLRLRNRCQKHSRRRP